MNRIKYIALIALASLTLTSNLAYSKEYKIVLIHGLQAAQLINDGNVSDGGQAYWDDYWGNISDARIDWPSSERVEGKIATDYLWPKLKEFSRSNFCNPGCIFVTHSTGDLIARYIIENQSTWLTNAGLTPLNIVATFDLAGAGGGSELADLAVSVAQAAESTTFLLESALEAWLGGDLTDEMGVLHDLKVNNARQLAPLPDASIPRLRFVGNDNDYLGVTSLFIKGHNDGVVGSHSACGASTQGNFGSCSASIDFNGKSTGQNDAVTSFMPYHYPMLMSDSYSHSTLKDGAQKGKVTAASSHQSMLSNNTIEFDTYNTTQGWWLWKKQYVFVKKSDEKSMSRLIYDALPD